MIDIDKIEAAVRAAKRFDWVACAPHVVSEDELLKMVSMIRERDAQVAQLQEQNTYLDKVAADLQELCDKQAKALGRVATSPVFSTGDAAVAYLHGYTKAADERDAVLKQALSVLEDCAVWESRGDPERPVEDVIAAIKGVLNERPD